MAWKVSRYTHVIPVRGRALLYNGRTGAVAELDGRGRTRVHRLLDTLASAQPLPRRSDQLARELAAGGFIVRSDLDELAVLESQFERGRQRSQFLLTILPTFGCDLACSYCFVGKKTGTMARVHAQRLPSMHVDWFGGEPLLALPIVERLSGGLQRLCASHEIPYRAQIITNGTQVTPAAVDVLLRSAVDRVQISIDGPAAVHDRRRPSKAGRQSSFDQIVDALPLLVGRFTIRLRINIDTRNADSV